MKLLLYCLNYAPEITGIGKYTTEQAEWLAARGHDVRVITGPPYYPAWRVASGYSGWQYRRETLNGVRIYRTPLWVPQRPSGLKRLIHLASFAASSLPVLWSQWTWRPDVLMLVEPPLACAPAALLFGRWRQAATWLHIQDYEVDAAFALGLLKHPALKWLATRLEQGALARFDRISTISQAMLARARQKGVPPSRLVMLPNAVDLRAIRPLADHKYREMLGIAPDAVVALYSGNMGAKQGLELLAESARLLAGHRHIHFIYCGDGAGRADLADRCEGLQRVHFLPLQSARRFPALLASADIHLMPQRADAADLVLPSKLTGMLASGRPVIATAHAGTELATLVAQCGVVVPPGDAPALAHAIATLAEQPVRRGMLGAAGRAWAERHLDREAVFLDLESTLLQLVLERSRDEAAAAGIGND
ncbi:glycosyltransferase WbuB [Cupriavidus sp. D384]|uniref:glycosyltransferase WbuB n=1 Tax=Cupriavidus sp. D384 TaxID=1538095 RepID=UPI00082A1B0A|nr:glycosyltransferase WbuB [Cupriavidus sp. D384]